MSELILIPGNHILIHEWMLEVEAKLADFFDSTYILDYLHWADGAKFIYLDRERERLADYVANRSGYLFLAKSVGVLLALDGMARGELKPKACIFIGTPVSRAADVGFDFPGLLSQLKAPTLFIQNDSDPTGSADDLARAIDASESIQSTVKIWSGDTHDYEDLPLLRSQVGEFLANLAS